MNEQELISRLKQGDEAAFRWLVEAYRNRVYGIVLHIVRDPAEAEDAAQETFIRVHGSISSFREDSKLSTWIFRIAVHKALEKIRRNKARQRLQSVMPWWMPDERDSMRASWVDPAIRTENREKARALFGAIASLPEKQRIAFTLIVVHGMTYEEVCGIMLSGVKAVESLVSRAKANLRKHLGRYRDH